MVRVFPKSANQPNEMALTICTSISRNCFRLMRDWKLESLANGKEISAVPFRTKKEEYVYMTCYDQLTPVKSSHPLTSTTWPYRGLKFIARRFDVFY